MGLAVTACGTSSTQSSGEPRGSFPVQVTSATFPSHQALAQQTVLEIAVRNAGTRPIPDIAVTLLNPRYGAAAQALGTLISPAAQGQPLIARRSRPVWVIDQAPGPCSFSCHAGGAGGAATASSNTWALGRLEPGATARFDWHVTAMRAGSYTVVYQVAASPVGGRARAVSGGAAGPGGRGPVAGSFRVTVSSAAPVPYVTSSGKVRYSAG